MVWMLKIFHQINILWTYNNYTNKWTFLLNRHIEIQNIL